MGFFSADDNEITIKNDLDVHDLTLYVLYAVLILALVLFYLKHKYKKINKRIQRANNVV